MSPVRALQDIHAISERVCVHLRGVLFDIDDTFTLGGKILPGAFSALWQAHDAGLLLVPITGRPAGWADHIARMWPVDAVVGENGAFYFRRDPKGGKLEKRFHVSDPGEREQNRRRLVRMFEAVQDAYPEVALASDQAYRECDLAVDFCEDVLPPLPLDAAERIREIFEAGGANAKVSSIHVNAWFGQYDKLTMCRTLLGEVFGIDLDRSVERFLFCGDSPNDGPMFAHFPVSAGVRGVRAFLEAGMLEHAPAYLASKEGSLGFEEIVRVVLAKRAHAGSR